MILAFDAKRLFNNFTGLGNYSRTLVRNLQKFYPEHEYHLFTPKIVQNAETDYFLDSGKFTIHHSRFPLWRTFGMSLEINRLSPDIFHGLSHELPVGLRADIKKVVTFHDLIYELYPKQFGLWDRTMYAIKYKFSAKKADQVICISQSTKDDLKRLYNLPENKIRVLYQSCHDIFQTQKTVSSLDFNKQDYYLYVGSLIERKNVLQVIRAYSMLDAKYQKPFVIVGSGPKKHVDEIKSLIAQFGLSSHFEFISHINNEQLVTVYDRCYLLCYPSVYEGFGIPVIEALFRKKPVITSDLSSLPEAAGPGALLVNPYNPEQIRDAFIKLNDKTVYSKLAEEGHQYVTAAFSARSTADSLMAFYQAIVNS